MVFATTCFGNERRNDTLHLLNDIRNLGYDVFVITNIELHLEYFQFNNVKIIKVDTPYYHDFFRYELILEIFKNTNEELIYYLDCDSRFFDFRLEKFKKEKFESLIISKDFEILSAWLEGSVKEFFESPVNDENKKIRQFKYGYSNLIKFMLINYPNYNDYFNLPNCWEGHLIFKKTEKVLKFLEEIIKIGNILIEEDIKNNREHIACTSSSLISLLSEMLDINLKMDSITHHFFKANFLKEIFPYNYKIDINEKVFTNNN